MIPKSILKQQAEYERRIRTLEDTIRLQAKTLKAYDKALQDSLSERLKCLRCRVTLRKERDNNASKS